MHMIFFLCVILAGNYVFAQSQSKSSEASIPLVNKSSRPASDLGKFSKPNAVTKTTTDFRTSEIRKALPADPNAIPDEPEYTSSTGTYNLPLATPVAHAVLAEGTHEKYQLPNDLSQLRQGLIQSFNQRFNKIESDFNNGTLSPEAYQAQKYHLQQEYQQVIDTY